MQDEEKQMTGQESLHLITNMIQKAKASYHETGASLLLWGFTVCTASLVTYFKYEYQFDLPFDIWLIVLAAIIPQVFISIKEKKSKQYKGHLDIALNAVWITYALSIFGLMVYSNIVPQASVELIKSEGWEMIRHYTDGSKPDEVIKPFAPSIYSLYILLYAMPTLVMGLVKNYKPMIIGAVIAYVAFVVSCFTASKYDMLMGAGVALFCWIIPGILLRKRYLNQKKGNV